MASYEMVTEGGYPLDEVTSALQKTIRRGLEKEALYWAIELNSKYPIYTWKRLVTIVTEDIGGANPALVTQIASLFNAVVYIHSKSNKKPREYDICILSHAVLAMARSPKSREGDDMVNQVLRERREGQMFLSIPDYALDCHTKRGREMGRDTLHFWEVGAVIANEAYPSKYTGWDPDFGDGWHTADRKRAKSGLKGSVKSTPQSSLFGDE